MDDKEFELLAAQLRSAWRNDPTAWDALREGLEDRNMCLRWRDVSDAEQVDQLLLEEHVDVTAALCAAYSGRGQVDCLHSAVILEKDSQSGRMLAAHAKDDRC